MCHEPILCLKSKTVTIKMISIYETSREILKYWYNEEILKLSKAIFSRGWDNKGEVSFPVLCISIDLIL